MVAGEREKETDRHRQTDRQTDRHKHTYVQGNVSHQTQDPTPWSYIRISQTQNQVSLSLSFPLSLSLAPSLSLPPPLSLSLPLSPSLSLSLCPSLFYTHTLIPS